MTRLARQCELIKVRQTKIVVIGNGVVGSRVLARAREVGFEAQSYDQDTAKSDFAALNEVACFADILIVCLPTGLDEEGRIDVSAPTEALKTIGNLNPPSPFLLVCLESTVPPGFCRQHWTSSEPFAYCPERIWPAGEPKWRIDNIPRVLATNGGPAMALATTLYSILVPAGFIHVDVEVAEFAKVYENTQRAVNILLAQELEVLCEARDVDVNHVLKACLTKPFGYADYFPGKIGGDCIPMAPAFLTENIERTWIVSAAMQTMRREKAKVDNDAASVRS